MSQKNAAQPIFHDNSANPHGVCGAADACCLQKRKMLAKISTSHEFHIGTLAYSVLIPWRIQKTTLC